MKRKLLIALGVLVAVALAVVLFGMSSRAIPETSRHAIDIEAWRTLADNPEGERPTELRVLEVVVNRVPQIAAIEDGSMSEHFDMRGYAFQVRWADGRTLIIDPINDEDSMGDTFPDATFDAAAWDEMQQAMRAADGIVVTHEHFDHLNGLTKSPYFDELIDKAVLSKVQVEADTYLTGVDERVRARVKPLDYSGTHALRRGVVLIEAPSHTVGSQIIYVRLADDREFMMVGDIAWNAANIRQLATRPRAVEWAMGELGDNTAHWLRAFHDLAEEHPEVHQIVAHDRQTVEPLVASGAIGLGFGATPRTP